MTTSVVIPVKDGARYLGEVLAAVIGENPDEILVVDSGSRDGSVSIARRAGAEVIEIPPDSFSHGNTRNLAAERTRGDVVAFLTQDATPVAGWLGAHLEALALEPTVGASFGPHLPRPDTSPMIARELEEFFAGFTGPDGGPALQRAGDEPFLSNVNASYRRSCWEQVRFRDVAYSEDQAFGRDMLAAGWTKAYHPRAAVLHAHDYGTWQFMRRYFDEYRGLREAHGHVEPFVPSAAVREVMAAVRADRRWLAQRGMHASDVTRWTLRSAVHHGGRRVFSSLGSRADRMPAVAQRALSLERRSDAVVAESPMRDLAASPPLRPLGSRDRPHDYEDVAQVLAHGPTPLSEPVPGMSDRKALHIAVIIPPFRRGSGGHGTIFQVVSRLERMGHSCSIWHHDPFGERSEEWAGVLQRSVSEYFSAVRAPLFKGFDDWWGADVVMATGWQTAWPAMRLDDVRARVYFVNDYETAFYPTSIESWFAEETYRLGMHCIAASPWLRDLLIDRFDASATDFQLGVDHDIYRPLGLQRREDTVVFYARAVTPRRAVPLGVLALEELKRRRPDLRVVVYGDENPPPFDFEAENAGVVTPRQLAYLYNEATVGLSLSMTNFSLIPKEMLACGLPCVELAGVSAESIFGEDGPLVLAPVDPAAIADRLERLLDDRDARNATSSRGIEAVRSHTWDLAAEQTEAGIREALRAREREAGWGQPASLASAGPS